MPQSHTSGLALLFRGTYIKYIVTSMYLTNELIVAKIKIFNGFHYVYKICMNFAKKNCRQKMITMTYFMDLAYYEFLEIGFRVKKMITF